jgi:RNA polymerase subunit RPABC4/transcription elongation factor Spt4
MVAGRDMGRTVWKEREGQVKGKGMKQAKDQVCPRCSGDVPNSEWKGRYPGALSRTDNETEICSDCGSHEAMEDYLNGSPLPQSEWVKCPA